MLSKVVVHVLLCCLLSGCLDIFKSGNGDVQWTDANAQYGALIGDYHEQSLGSSSKVATGKPGVYIDFSDGLIQAYTNSPTNQKIIEFISQKLVGSETEWYGLGKEFNGIGKLDYSTDRDIFNKVTSASSYVDIMAPIESALQKITQSSNDALLITDFEEYTPDGREQQFAYAKQYFQKWVEAGNSISFYYSPYVEKNQKSKIMGPKNLYFVIFNYGETSTGSLLTKFNEALANRGLSNLKHFDINPRAHTIRNDYGGRQLTGLCPDPNAKAELQVGSKENVVTYYRNALLEQQRPYEAMAFDFDLASIKKLYYEGQNRFTRKLYLDASKSTIYDIRSIRVNVTDVTDDFNWYVKCIDARNNKPKLVKDEGNNKVWDEISRSNPISAECYKENTTEIKDAYVYKYSGGARIDEVFDYDKGIFVDHLKNSPQSVELITTFHKNFSAERIDAGTSLIYRIDFVIESAEPKNLDQLNDFQWKSVIQKNVNNTSLYESIRNTIQAVKPQGILYSYYIKFEPSK